MTKDNSKVKAKCPIDLNYCPFTRDDRLTLAHAPPSVGEVLRRAVRRHDGELVGDGHAVQPRRAAARVAVGGYGAAPALLVVVLVLVLVRW